MPITKAQRRKALVGTTKIEGHAWFIRNKLQGPLSLAKLEDLDQHFKLLLDDVEDAHSAIRSALWHTRTR